MINFSINKFFTQDECKYIMDFCEKNGEIFIYNNTDSWDCKRVYNDEFKNWTLNKINTLYEENKIKFWFDYSTFNVKNVNVSITKYYEGRYLDLHLDKTSNYTTVIPITDFYDDGRFVLAENKNKDLKFCENKFDLKMGEGITFEGNKTFHGVMPVTNGLRCAFNIWMNDTDFSYYRLDKKNKLI